MNLLFLNPPNPAGGSANREGSAGMGTESSEEGGFVYPPHLLALAASAARTDGWEVAALDAQTHDWDTDTTLGTVAGTEAEIIAIPMTWATWETDHAFVLALRAARPEVRILAFGPALRFRARELMESVAVDGALIGEPEGAIGAAARAVADERATHTRPLLTPLELDVPGYDSLGRLQNPDVTPFPAWDLLPVERYAFLSILSSRGCSHGCRYCPYVAAQGDVFRAQTPSRTVDELRWLDQGFRPERIVFRDPVFAYDRERVLRLCALLQQTPLHAVWEVESRPEHFDDEVLTALAEAGCSTVKVGVESTVPDLLVRIGRVADAEEARRYCQQVRAMIATCRVVGIRCRAFAMTGLPGETRADVQRTAQDLAAWRPHALHVKPYQWYPGTELPPADIDDAAERAAAMYTRWGAEQVGWRHRLRRSWELIR